MGTILRLEGLSVSFGGVAAVSGVSFGIEEGTITGLIGPNGSGKTTLFNLVSGLLRPHGGHVWLDGRVITGWPPHRIAQRGLARTFQISRVFGQMTVSENMMVVARSVDASRRSVQERARDLLAQVNLYELREALGSDLSYGQQKLLELARALMLDPRIIMLDEPFAGVNPTLAQTIVALLERMRDEGKTVFVIDHVMTIIMRLCQRLLVMDMGELVADGAPAEVRRNERVLEAYFGSTGR